MYSLTDTSMHRPWNFRELGPVRYKTPSSVPCGGNVFWRHWLHYKEEKPSFSKSPLSHPWLNTVLRNRHTACTDALFWSSRCQAGGNLQCCCSLDFGLYSHLTEWKNRNRERDLAVFSPNSELLVFARSLLGCKLYLHRTLQWKRISSRVVLGYSCCCSESEPQM